MRNKKNIYATYAFYDRTGIQSFLEKQANLGWMLKFYTRDTWSFIRIEPKQLRFCIAYYPAAWNVEFNSPLSKKRQEFVDFCKHAGWELVCFNGAMHIFCSEEENPIPIETDAMTEMETIHKATKKTYLYTRIPTALLCLLWSIAEAMTLQYNTGVVEWTFDLTKTVTLFVYALIAGMDVILYYIWRKKSLAAIQTGNGFAKSRSFPYLGNLFVGILVLFTFLYMGVLLMVSVKAFWEFLIVLLCSCGFVGLILLLRLAVRSKDDN